MLTIYITHREVGIQSKKRVLVLDDDRNILEAFKRFFATQKGVEMIAYTTIAAGHSLLKKQKFDLLILNIGIDEFACLETLRYKKTHFPELPTIVISAYPEVSYKWDLKALGMDYFIPKPFDIQQLRKAVNFALSKNLSQLINQS